MGAGFSATKFIDDKWLPFLRVGYAEDGGAMWERSVSTGIGYYITETRDLLGIGLNWGRPAESDDGPDLDDQYTAELFYRLQLSPNLALTPDIQLIIDPALNPQEDTLWIFGFRARLTL